MVSDKKLCSCLFSHVFPIYALNVKHVTAVEGPFLAPGAKFEQTL